ncbi:MAG: precorrin-2 C(20)-methyltransferase [Deltaproteobacteria bacterium]|nr:precorrin-2 C(20)-methyltransferase [Deltaproteobacteria bacterium]
MKPSELKTGILYGVGIGPGDPELLTLKAVKILKQVDVIAVPKSKTEGESLALDIVKQAVDLSDKEILELTFPMKKEHDELIESWKEAKKQILKPLKKGRDVAFITIGDPLFYSTFIYLLEQFTIQNSQFKIKIIPGVSSINAVSAATQIPLAKAGERLAILPATYEQEKIRQTLKDFDTVVLIKVNKVMDKIISILEELDLKNNAVFVSKAGLPDEKIVTNLDSLKGKKLDYFSMVIVKKKILLLENQISKIQRF